MSYYNNEIHLLLSHAITGFGLIERAHGNLPKICKLPAISQGKSCPLSDFAWSYDVTSSRCRIVNTRGCAYATENQFVTEADCKRMCPEQVDLKITLMPTPEVEPTIRLSLQQCSGDSKYNFQFHLIAILFDYTDYKMRVFA